MVSLHNSQFRCILNPLESTLTCPLASVHYKGLAETLSSLESALTKNMGGGGVIGAGRAICQESARYLSGRPRYLSGKAWFPRQRGMQTAPNVYRTVPGYRIPALAGFRAVSIPSLRPLEARRRRPSQQACCRQRMNRAPVRRVQNLTDAGTRWQQSRSPNQISKGPCAGQYIFEFGARDRRAIRPFVRELTGGELQRILTSGPQKTRSRRRRGS